MTTHGIHQTWKHDFINLENLSRFHNHIFILMILRYFSVDVDPITNFKGDLIMMIYEIRVKPFEVMIIKRMANMP